MSQFPNSPDDTFSSAASGDDPTSAYAPTGWPFWSGAPVRVNAWGAPIFPPSWPSGLPNFASPFAPPTPQSSSTGFAWRSDWIANRSLFGAIPRELNKPAGSDGLLGLLARPTPRGGFFPSDEASIRMFLADRYSDAGQAAPPTQSGEAAAPSPPANPSSDSTTQPPADAGSDPTPQPAAGLGSNLITQPPAAASWYGFDAPTGVNAWGAPDFTQASASTPSSLPLFAWPFAPREGPQGSDDASWPLSDTSITKRSLAVSPGQQNQAPGSEGLPGPSAQLAAQGGPPVAPTAMSAATPWWLRWLGFNFPAPTTSSPTSSPAQLLWRAATPSSMRTAIEAARRGLAESGSESWDSGATILRALQGKQAFQDNEPSQSGTDGDEVGQLLRQPISEGWVNPDWWVANLSFVAAKSSPSTGLALVGMGIGSEARPGWGTAAGAAAGYGIGALFQTLGPAYQRARAEGLDHDAAVDRALKETGVATAFAGILGGAPGVSMFGKTIEGAVNRPISELLAQIFAVQPTIATAEDATTRALDGKPITPSDLLSDYGHGVASGLVTGGTQSALRQWRGSAWWDLPIQRGRNIEQQLGQNLHPDYKVIDIHDPETGAVTSIKSIDLRAAGYRNRPAGVYSKLSGAVDDLAEFEGANYADYEIEEGSVTSKNLLVAVPKFQTTGQQDALNRLIQYGTQRGVTVKIVRLR